MQDELLVKAQKIAAQGATGTSGLQQSIYLQVTLINSLALIVQLCASYAAVTAVLVVFKIRPFGVEVRQKRELTQGEQTKKGSKTGMSTKVEF